MSDKTIIALKGKGGCGKTTTIGKLHLLLIEKGFDLLETNFSVAGANRDFHSIFIVNGIRIGISSKGDSYDDVKGDLNWLIKEKCPLLICACRTFDRKNKKGEVKGSNYAIDSYAEYTSIRKRKSVSGNKHDTASTERNNEKDAKMMFEELMKVI